MNKTLVISLFTLVGLLGAPLASASPELARSKNCMACHAVDKKLVGPSYKDVAAKYANDKDAVAKLAKKIREGGVGSFGQIPMPANPQVSEAEARTLAAWVMAQK
jgi:cytochrome c